MPALAPSCRRLPFYGGDAAGMLAGAEAMLDCLEVTRRPSIRWYATSDRALVLGAGQNVTAVDASACRAAGITVYQRAAGGAAVLLDRQMLGLDVVLPREHPLLLNDLTQSYRWLGETWAAALQALGIHDAQIVPVDVARARTRETNVEARLARLACYGGLSPFEVVVEGRKIVGLAQARRRHGALFPVGLILRWDPTLLARLLVVPPAMGATFKAALAARVVGLYDVLARTIAREHIMAAVEAALIKRGLAIVDAEWTAEERALAARLRAERYSPLSLPRP